MAGTGAARTGAAEGAGPELVTLGSAGGAAATLGVDALGAAGSAVGRGGSASAAGVSGDAALTLPDGSRVAGAGSSRGVCRTTACGLGGAAALRASRADSVTGELDSTASRGVTASGDALVTGRGGTAATCGGGVDPRDRNTSERSIAELGVTASVAAREAGSPRADADSGGIGWAGGASFAATRGTSRGAGWTGGGCGVGATGLASRVATRGMSRGAD